MVRHSHSLSLFVSDEHELDDCKVDEATRTILLNNIRRRLTPQAVKCRAGLHRYSLLRQGPIIQLVFHSDVEVACYGYEGVDAVKAALKEGLSASTEEMPVKVKRAACRDHRPRQVLVFRSI